MKILFNWKIITIFIAFVFIAVCTAAFFYIKHEIKKPLFLLKDKTLIEIKNGEGSKSIGSDLASLGIIRNKKIFYLAVVLYQKEMRPGFYEITPDLSILDIINLIDSGKVKLVKVTFPEGWRSEQMAQKLAENHIISYDDFMAEAKRYEGKLFPDTYFFNPRMNAKDIVNMMIDDYNKRISNLKVSEKDLIIASIVEREAANDSQRALIAGVYQNRLDREMKLEADPTVQYGRDNNEVGALSASSALLNFDFWNGVSISDYLSVVSPYNTYLIAGLPPGPICNPGIESIKAALNPAKHNYLYFLQKGGEIYPSETPAQHDYYRATVLGASL